MYTSTDLTNPFNMATNPRSGNTIFLTSLGPEPPGRLARVATAHSYAQVTRLDIHSAAHSCNETDTGIVLSQVISTPFDRTITAVATSLDGKYLAVGDDHGRVEVSSFPS